jgi:hypothetical protein
MHCAQQLGQSIRTLCEIAQVICLQKISSEFQEFLTTKFGKSANPKTLLLKLWAVLAHWAG